MAHCWHSLIFIAVEEVHIYMQENSFNLMSCNPEILIIQHLRRADLRIFTGKELYQ
jgi:hypothetical protein